MVDERDRVSAAPVRFLSGTEIWYTDKLPEVGATISRNGDTYRVTYLEEIARGAFALNVVGEDASEDVRPAFA